MVDSVRDYWSFEKVDVDPRKLSEINPLVSDMLFYFAFSLPIFNLPTSNLQCIQHLQFDTQDVSEVLQSTESHQE